MAHPVDIIANVIRVNGGKSAGQVAEAVVAALTDERIVVNEQALRVAASRIVRAADTNGPSWKIGAIRDLRIATGAGLKSAKDAIEWAYGNPMADARAADLPVESVIGFRSQVFIKRSCGAPLDKTWDGTLGSELSDVGADELLLCGGQVLRVGTGG